MTTARTIVKKALQKIGVLIKKEDPTADEASDGLDSLNALLSSWSNDTLVTYKRVWQQFNLTGGDGEYTIGTGGDFNTDRPINIYDAYVRLATTDYPLRIMGDDIYAGIPNKAIMGLPQSLNFDNNYPLAKIRLYPVPDQSYQLFLQTENELQQFDDLDELMELPPGWERALIFNLGIELAPEYGAQVPPEVSEIASTSRTQIMNAVLRNKSMDALPERQGKFNVYTRRG